MSTIHSTAAGHHLTEKSTSSIHREHALLSEEGAATPPAFDDVETSKMLRKVDYRLLPVLSFLYLLAYLDRSNLGNAKVAGLSEDLALTGSQYNMAATVFFFTYCLLEVPANVMLKYLRPSVWIGSLVVAWGTVTTCTGAVQDYNGLIVARTMLGVAEAGFFPAATYLVSAWYCRFEVQTRIGIFYTAASLAGAFSGLLAFGISKMDGVSGLEGWRWIFILEGIVTVLTGISVFWLLPNSPETSSWLTEREKAFIRYRLEQDAGTKKGKVSTTEKFQFKFLVRALTDWKLWFTVCIYWGSTVPNYAFTFTAPQIILDLGYTAAQAQLLTIPPYTVATISVLVCSRLADRYQTRWKFIFYPYLVALIGFIGLLATPQDRFPGLCYFWLFPVIGGCYPGVITVVSWIANNASRFQRAQEGRVALTWLLRHLIAPSSKRVIGMASTLMMANFGGVIGSNIFLAREAPRYWSGYGACAGLITFAMASTVFLRAMYVRVNNKRDQWTEEDVRAKYTEEELLDLGDKSPLYRYVY